MEENLVFWNILSPVNLPLMVKCTYDMSDDVHVYECSSDTFPIQWAKTGGCCIPAGVLSSGISHRGK
jgi:hypothetical protein